LSGRKYAFLDHAFDYGRHGRCYQFLPTYRANQHCRADYSAALFCRVWLGGSAARRSPNTFPTHRRGFTLRLFKSPRLWVYFLSLFVILAVQNFDEFRKSIRRQKPKVESWLADSFLISILLVVSLYIRANEAFQHVKSAGTELCESTR